MGAIAGQKQNMAEAEKTFRLSKAIKEFNLSLDHIVDFLTKKGFKVESNPNTKLPGDAYALLLKEFQGDKSAKEEAQQQRHDRLLPGKPRGARQPAVQRARLGRGRPASAAPDFGVPDVRAGGTSRLVCARSGASGGTRRISAARARRSRPDLRHQPVARHPRLQS